MSIANRCDRLVVMSEGRIVKDGSPAEIFARDGELTAIGLDLPGPAHIARLLRQRGVALPAGIFTVEQLTDAILALGRRGGAPC